MSIVHAGLRGSHLYGAENQWHRIFINFFTQSNCFKILFNNFAYLIIIILSSEGLYLVSILRKKILGPSFG